MALNSKENTPQKMGGIVPEVELNRILSQRSQLKPTDSDIGSNYALQVALRNMKERCQRQQKKIELMEEENDRLIHNKSELYEEIAKLRETQIKLREKNLHLSQEIHTKHQEGCSVRESLTSLSKEHADLMNTHNRIMQENRQLKKDVQQLAEENAAAQESLRQLTTGTKQLPLTSRSTMTQTDDESSPRSRLSRANNTISPNDIRFQQLKQLHKRYSSPTFTGDPSTDGDSSSKGILRNLQREKVQVELQLPSEQKEILSQLSSDDATVIESFRKQHSMLQTLKSELQLHKKMLYTCLTNVKEKPKVIERSGSGDSANEPKTLVDGGDAMVSVSLEDGSKEVRSACTSPINQAKPTHTCPMCEAVFPDTMPTEDFENHVLNHFENSESLLIQYEML